MFKSATEKKKKKKKRKLNTVRRGWWRARERGRGDKQSRENPAPKASSFVDEAAKGREKKRRKERQPTLRLRICLL